VGGALCLLGVGLRGVRVDPTRPPSRVARFPAALLSPALSARVLGGLAVVALTLAVTGWPVAAVGLGALVVCWPALFAGTTAERRQIASLEALVTWTETLRDTIAAHASLEQAIPASAVNAPPLIRPALVRLVGQLRARVSADTALLALATELDDPSADLVIAALMLSATRRGDRLGEVLTGLTTTAREELEMRRKISAGRAELRRGVQIVVAVTIAIGVFLVAFSGAYIAPYGTPAGQIALAVVLGIFVAAFLWMRKLSVQRPVPPFLSRPGHQPNPDSARPHTALTDRYPPVTRVVIR
jgi:Flp pilus assembly protein TadB